MIYSPPCRYALAASEAELKSSPSYTTSATLTQATVLVQKGASFLQQFSFTVKMGRGADRPIRPEVPPCHPHEFTGLRPSMLCLMHLPATLTLHAMHSLIYFAVTLFTVR